RIPPRPAVGVPPAPGTSWAWARGFTDESRAPLQACLPPRLVGAPGRDDLASIRRLQPQLGRAVPSGPLGRMAQRRRAAAPRASLPSLGCSDCLPGLLLRRGDGAILPLFSSVLPQVCRRGLLAESEDRRVRLSGVRISPRHRLRLGRRVIARAKRLRLSRPSWNP